MQICCPHCQIPFDSVEDASLSDLVCPSCGDSFSLFGEGTTRTYQPGVRVLGRFELLHEVGAGRFGSVWKARDTELQRVVAIKIPRQQDLDPHETELFLRDARAAAQLKHPHIASVHEVGREDDTVYIVTDFIDGANLSEWLSGRRLTMREAAELVIKIAEGLHHAHEKGVVHRDVKPGNIMLDRSGEPFVIDFGLARRDVGEMTMTVEGQVLGTPAYMPPEQARGEGHRADGRSDLYSLGVILFRLLTGELPFRGETRMLIVQILEEEPPGLRKLNANVPRDLETITLKCLEKEPAKRYQTGRELVDDLRRFLAGEPIKARPVGRLERGWRWCKRHPEIAGLSAALLVVLLGAAIIAPIVAVQQARLRQESELRRIEAQNLVAHNLFQRANEEYAAGRIAEGIALLASAYRSTAGRDNALGESVRGLMSGWSRAGGRPLVQDGVVLAAAISPDGRSAIVGGHDRDATARLWDIETATPLGQPLQHAGSVRAVAFSPDGRLALTGSVDKSARLWNVGTGQPVAKPMHHAGSVWAAAFNRDGSMVITGGRDGTARLWDAHTGEPIGKPLDHGPRVLAVCFDGVGRYALTGSSAGTAQRWNVRTQERDGEPIQVGKPVYAVAFSPDGGKLLTGGADNTVRIWNAETLQSAGEPMRHENYVYAAMFSPDGRTLLSGSFDNTAQLWDAQTSQPIGQPLRHAGWVMSVAFSPDGRTALTGAADRTVRLWNIVEGRPLSHDGAVRAVTFSPDGHIVLTGGDDRTARLWNARTGEAIGAAFQHDAAVLAVAISPDGNVAMTTDAQFQVRLWDARTGNRLAKTWKLRSAPWNIQFSLDGKKVLFLCRNQSVELWDFDAGRALAEPLQFNETEIVTAGSPDEGIVVVRPREGGAARLCEVRSGRFLGNPLEHDVQVMDAAFRGDGRVVATAGYDQEVRLWAVPSGRPIGEAFSHGGIVNAVCFSRDGQTVLSGSSDQTARLWNAASSLPIGSPLQHSSEVSKVALSPDGRLALTVCKDKSAYLWDVESCKLLARPLQHEIGVNEGIFNNDGSEIVFRCADGPKGENGSARLYDVPELLDDDPNLIDAWARARSGYQCSEKGVLRQLSQAEWLEAQQELVALEQAE